MLRKLLSITWLQVKTTYQERSSLVFGILMPIVFTFVIGIGISGFGPDEESAQTWQVNVVNQDSGSLSTLLIERMSSNPILDVSLVDQALATAQLEEGDSSATLIIPSEMSIRLLDRETVVLEFRLNAEEPLSAQVVEQAVLAAMNELSSSLDIADASTRIAEQLGLFDADGPAQTDYFEEGLSLAIAEWEAGAPIAVEAQKETQREENDIQVPLGFEQTSPGIAVMFAMFFVVSGAGTILLEREQGTLRRLLTTPASKATILGGKLLGVFISATIQFSLLVLVGQLAFDVDWGQSPAALIVIVLAFTFSITALGMLAASLVRTYAQIDAISTVLILPLAGLGGAMWPIEIVPEFMQRIALWVPTGWAMRGFHDIITRGLGLQDILLEAGMLMLFGIAFLSIGLWRFKYE
jgi:ABC-2 type transport system permease protein